MLKRVGNKLFLVGVAHIFPQSSREVEEIIKKEKPAVVGLELCQERYDMLRRGASQPSSNEMIDQKTSIPILWRLMHYLQSYLSRHTGTPAGREMITAAEAAREVGARIEFIDQSFRTTMEKLISRMGTIEKMKLLVMLSTAMLPIGRRLDLEKFTEEETVERILREVKKISKTMYEVLIKERDWYMAEKISLLLTKTDGKIVCVVGAGHLPGISRILSKSWVGRYEWEASDCFYT